MHISYKHRKSQRKSLAFFMSTKFLVELTKQFGPSGALIAKHKVDEDKLGALIRHYSDLDFQLVVVNCVSVIYLIVADNLVTVDATISRLPTGFHDWLNCIDYSLTGIRCIVFIDKISRCLVHLSLKS